MRIAIDAMGGDKAPAAPVAGALRALEAFDDIAIVLVGESAALEAELTARGAATSDRLTLHDAPLKVGSEDPVKAVRSSPKVSARACADLLRAGEVEGVLTMGSTGAAVAAATLYCRRLPGVRRTGIAVPIPNTNGVSVLVDGGANPDAKANELHQYAVMGAEYARAAFGIATPRVGILSIGEEETKGNRLVAETWAAFRADPIEHFVGNIEPHTLFEGGADVVVCDGFTGNIVLKTAEGMAGYIMGSLPKALAGAGVADPRPILREMASRVDFEEYGGSPLLGVEGAYMIGHGRSGPTAYFNGLRVIRAYVLGNVGARIVERLATPAGEA